MMDYLVSNRHRVKDFYKKHSILFSQNTGNLVNSLGKIKIPSPSQPNTYSKVINNSDHSELIVYCMYVA